MRWWWFPIRESPSSMSKSYQTDIWSHINNRNRKIMTWISPRYGLDMNTPYLWPPNYLTLFILKVYTSFMILIGSLFHVNTQTFFQNIVQTAKKNKTFMVIVSHRFWENEYYAVTSFVYGCKTCIWIWLQKESQQYQWYQQLTPCRYIMYILPGISISLMHNNIPSQMTYLC